MINIFVLDFHPEAQRKPVTRRNLTPCKMQRFRLVDYSTALPKKDGQPTVFFSCRSTVKNPRTPIRYRRLPPRRRGDSDRGHDLIMLRHVPRFNNTSSAAQARHRPTKEEGQSVPISCVDTCHKRTGSERLRK